MLAYSFDFSSIGIVARAMSFIGFLGGLSLAGFLMCVVCGGKLVFVSCVFVALAVPEMAFLLLAGGLFALRLRHLLGQRDCLFFSQCLHVFRGFDGFSQTTFFRYRIINCPLSVTIEFIVMGSVFNFFGRRCRPTRTKMRKRFARKRFESTRRLIRRFRRCFDLRLQLL